MKQRHECSVSSWYDNQLAESIHLLQHRNMGKNSRARGRGGSQLGGRSAAPVGTSGRAKSLRNGAVNRREKVDEHIPASLVTESDEDESEDGSEEDGSEGGSEEDENAEEDGEEESGEEEEEEVTIGVPVAMWVSLCTFRVLRVTVSNTMRRTSTIAIRNDAPGKS
jgi:hypothetical protein